MIEHLPRIADMFFGFCWGFIVFYVIPQGIKEHKQGKKEKTNRWWTKLDVKDGGK